MIHRDAVFNAVRAAAGRVASPLPPAPTTNATRVFVDRPLTERELAARATALAAFAKKAAATIGQAEDQLTAKRRSELAELRTLGDVGLEVTITAVPGEAPRVRLMALTATGRRVMLLNVPAVDCFAPE